MSMIHFAKYQALENDFCIVGPKHSGFRWSPSRVADFCHRRRGIGADGLIILGKPSIMGVRFRLFNADGSDAEWSGNGVRCAAAHVAGAKRRAEVRLLTAVGPIDLQVTARGSTKFLASFERPLPKVGPVVARGAKLTPRRSTGPIPVDAGNPHWIFVVPNFDFPWMEIGQKAQKLTPRTHGVNVEFVRVLNRRRIELRIFERGVGPTPSSGSGALAALAACAELGLINPTVNVFSPGGEQMVEIDGEMQAMRLTAITHHVFSGVWEAV